MANQQSVDITELAVLGEQFPLDWMQGGFRLMQVIDATGQDAFRYVKPPLCSVPAGSFLIGSDQQQDSQAWDDEMPQHTVTLDAFDISTYPLTAAEYRLFLQATGHRAPTGWSEVHQHAGHPIMNVSWEDVLAYTQWLSQVTGERWQFPTEAEWEKAARGTDGRIYPWGNQWEQGRANVRGSGFNMTSPVGSYPIGMSPYGCYDMAGNVCEWTSTTYQPYPYQASDGREDLSSLTDKVLRGGSWESNSGNARVAGRHKIHPTHGYHYTGARLVLKNRAG